MTRPPRGPEADAAWLSPAAIVAVASGALIGTTLRYLAGLAVPAHSGTWPTATFVVNVAGAFALGLLLELLGRLGPLGRNEGRLRSARLALGTGLLGAFTTYSTLALEVVHLLEADRVALAGAYAVGSVVLGLLAAAAGVATAQHAVHRRDPDGPAS